MSLAHFLFLLKRSAVGLRAFRSSSFATILTKIVVVPVGDLSVGGNPLCLF